MVGFDFVKTRTLAYVQSYDWLPIIVQFSKICYQLAPLHSKCCLNWRLDYSIKFSSFRQALFQNFLEVFLCSSFVLCPNDLYSIAQIK